MLFNKIISGLALALSFTSAVRAYADPGLCSGDCWAHDPSLIRRASDGVYFRFNTGSEIGIWKADSLTGPWVYQGKVLPNGSSINLAGNTDCWVCAAATLLHSMSDLRSWAGSDGDGR
jgi:arabinan endo-1,5-alpha-L-arabinosidase